MYRERLEQASVVAIIVVLIGSCVTFISSNNFIVLLNLLDFTTTLEPTIPQTTRTIPIPSQIPTEVPTQLPTEAPTQLPTKLPTEIPTQAPTEVPTQAPTVPTEVPTQLPTQLPTEAPTQMPTEVPTQAPTVPTEVPTQAPTVPTEVPTQAPTEVPTEPPTQVLTTNECLCKTPDCKGVYVLAGTHIPAMSILKGDDQSTLYIFYENGFADQSGVFWEYIDSLGDPANETCVNSQIQHIEHDVVVTVPTTTITPTIITEDCHCKTPDCEGVYVLAGTYIPAMSILKGDDKSTLYIFYENGFADQSGVFWEYVDSLGAPANTTCVNSQIQHIEHEIIVTQGK